MSVIALERELSQLTFEGWPEPESTYFSLSSARNLPTDAELAFEQHVSGRFEGVVSGVKLEKRGGELVKVWTILVLEGTLD